MFQGKGLKDISDRDITKLIDEKIAEDTTLEYKRDPWQNDATGREELLKDVSAMANSQGGYIIIGVNTIKDNEGQDIPSGKLFSVKKPDLVSQSILDKCRRFIDPRIQGLETHIVSITQEEVHDVLILYIPESEKRPHACISDKATFFVQRQGNVVVPLSPHEIETLRSASSIPKLTEFVEEVHLKLGHIESKLDSVLSKGVRVLSDLSDITDPNQLLNLSRDKYIGED